MSDPADLAGELRLAVHRLTRRLRQQGPTNGLTLTQLSALAIVWRDGPLSAGDLAQREQVRPPSITRVLTALEQMDLITREGNPNDGRQVLVRITALGDERMRTYVQQRERWLAELLTTFSDDDREVLHRAALLLEDLAAR